MSRRRIYWWAIAVWLLFFVIAFSLEFLREVILVPAIGEHAAHVIGTLAFVGLILVITHFFVRRIRATATGLWLIGFVWLCLTVAFEFLFFHFVMDKPWEVLLADYNVVESRIWILVLVAEMFGPPFFGCIGKRNNPGIWDKR